MAAIKEFRICMGKKLKPGEEWISPCACTRTLKWVHRSCIDEWVTQGAVDHDQRTRCNTCRWEERSQLSYFPGPTFDPLSPFRHEYPRERRITELNFLPVPTLLFVLTLGLAVRSHGALKLLSRASRYRMAHQ